jgi:diguanylate cyclase (GGDEF)-like protein
MESIRSSILKCIYDHVDSDDHLIAALNQIVAEHGPGIYQVILHVLTHLDLSPDKAETCWKEILSHRDKLSKILGRDPSLRTVICDYFCSIDKSLKNPIVIEIHIFEETANSSKFDSLTGLYSRGFFEIALEREIARAKRYKTELSVLFFDLDDFKNINDTYGHLVGDSVLKQVSRIIIEETRSEDTAARYGGEEIIVIMPETGKTQSLVSGERIRRKVKTLKPDHGESPLHVTLSGGLATYPIDARGSSDLIRCADEALYSAKQAGKDNIAFFSKDKRRHHRINYSAEIKGREIGLNESADFVGAGKNISVTGIRFESSTAMENGAKVQLHIPIQGEEQSIFIIGTVLRSEATGPGRFDVSVSFLDVDNRSLKLFNKLFPPNTKYETLNT